MAWDKTKPIDAQKLKDLAALIRANFEALELMTDAALQITNAKCASDMGLVDTKLAEIGTADKVNCTALKNLANTPTSKGAFPAAVIPNTDGSKLVGLANIPSGSGVIPAANVPNTDGSKMVGLANIPSGSGVIPTANLPTIPDPKVYVNALGTVSGTITMQVDKVNTAALSDNVTLTMPTPTTGELHTVVFEFTMSVAKTVTVSGVTWNYGVTPGLATGTTKNRMAFDTIDGGTTWKGYYSQF